VTNHWQKVPGHMHTCWKSGQESLQDGIENQHSKASTRSCLSLTAIPWSENYFEVKKNGQTETRSTLETS
jgi:hypothetical protein